MKRVTAQKLAFIILTPFLFLGGVLLPKDGEDVDIINSDPIQQALPQCYWNEHYYSSGEHFCNEALQEWVCNEDGSYSYTGNSGVDVCPGNAGHCIWNGNIYSEGEKFCNAAFQEWLCQSDGTYVFTGNTGGEFCPGLSSQCVWDGTVYFPGEYFCNAANQQWLCKSDGTYAYTGNTGEDICSGVLPQCNWNGVNYQVGGTICDSSCQQWACQSNGSFIFTGSSGTDVCPGCTLPTPTVVTPTITPVVDSNGCQFSNNSSYEDEIYQLVNQVRTDAGLPALALDGKLSVAARSHSQDMACNDFFSHTGSNGYSPYDRITQQGYSYSSAGENIAGGNSSPQSIVDGWLSSEGHKRNMLSENYSQIGVGYVYRSGSTYGGYWTTNFGHP